MGNQINTEAPTAQNKGSSSSKDSFCGVDRETLRTHPGKRLVVCVEPRGWQGRTTKGRTATQGSHENQDDFQPDLGLFLEDAHAPGAEARQAVSFSEVKTSDASGLKKKQRLRMPSESVPLHFRRARTDWWEAHAPATRGAEGGGGGRGRHPRRQLARAPPGTTSVDTEFYAHLEKNHIKVVKVVLSIEVLATSCSALSKSKLVVLSKEHSAQSTGLIPKGTTPLYITRQQILISPKR